MAMELDAIVLSGPLSRVRIAGLSAGERAVRVARRVGATRIHVVALDGAADHASGGAEAWADGTSRGARAELVAWRAGRTCPVLVIRADQLVHTPLVAPLVAAAPDGLAIAVGPDDAYAGALLATGAAAREVVAALARGDRDTAIAAGATSRIAHGEIARHAIATADERRAAHRLLYRILIKPQDNAITRYLYRPVSFPLTRLLVWTPITPNQVSYLVAAIVVLGCWLTAGPTANGVVAGTAVILAASYLDCCDGEIARVKLLSSRWGAWLDTIVDELSSVGYLAALGWHCHLAYGPGFFGAWGTAQRVDPWIVALGVGVVAIAVTMYSIYYNIIVVVGSANSQDYAGRVEAVPGRAPGSVRLRPAVAAPTVARAPRPRWLALIVTYAPYIIRRDFISWAALAIALTHAIHALFAVFLLGAVVTGVIVAFDHLQLQRLRRSILRRGQIIEPLS